MNIFHTKIFFSSFLQKCDIFVKCRFIFTHCAAWPPSTEDRTDAGRPHRVWRTNKAVSRTVLRTTPAEKRYAARQCGGRMRR